MSKGRTSSQRKHYRRLKKELAAETAMRGGKIRFPSLQLAKEAATLLNETRTTPRAKLHAYACPFCQYCHLGSRKRGKNKIGWVPSDDLEGY